MIQQINLYVEELKYVEPKFSFAFMSRFLIYVSCISISFSFFLYLTNMFVSKFQDEKEIEAHQITQSLIRVKKEYPKPEVDQKLIIKIKDLEVEKNRNKEIVKYLRSRSLDIENQEFSVYMKAFTQVKQKDLWLTNVSIKDAGKSISFKGKTFKSENLSNFLFKLKNLNVFHEMEFKIFNINREDKILNFEISTLKEGLDRDEMVLK